MHTLNRTVAGEERDFYVYTQEEADDEGVQYRPWQMMTGAGQWAVSDDGYVFECCKVQKYPKPERKRIAFFLTFSCCRKWLTRHRETGEPIGNPTLEVKEFLEEEAYYMTSPEDWIDRELRTSRAQRCISMFATLFIAKDGDLTDKEWDVIGKAYRPSEKIPAASAKSLFKKQKTRDMANAKIAQLLNDAGVTRASVVQNMESLREKAESDGSYNTAYRVLEKQMEMLGIDGDLPAGGDGAPKQLEENEVKLLTEMESELEEADHE
jgi:hypothetical protein